jgi:hypothetical protein
VQQTFGVIIASAADTISAMSAPPGILQRTLIGVALAHAGVLWWLAQHQVAITNRPIAVPVLTRWLRPPAERSAAPPAMTAVPVAAKSRGAAAPTRLPVRPLAPISQATTTAQENPLPPVDAASATALRTDGIQRAAREAAQRKGLAELSDERLGQRPVSAQATLSVGMATAALGDCLKGGEGGYRHSDSGLLALPLFALDVAAGRCRK